MFTGLEQRCSVHQWQEPGTILVHRPSANSLCPWTLASPGGQPGRALSTDSHCSFLSESLAFSIDDINIFSGVELCTGKPVLQELLFTKGRFSPVHLWLKSSREMKIDVKLCFVNHGCLVHIGTIQHYLLLYCKPKLLLLLTSTNQSSFL